MRGKSRDKDDNDTASSLAGRGKRRSKSSGSRSAKGGSDSRQDRSAKPSRRGSVVKRIRQSRFMKEPGRIMGPRLLFIASVAVLLTFGLIMVYSASSITAYNDFHDAAYYVKRQVTFMAIGIVACIACAKIPYRFWCSPTVFVVLWFITVLLLTATAFGLGVSALGAERSIMIAGFALQPAEFAKIVILMTCASLFELWHEGKFEFRHFIGILAVATLVPLILIYRQPDLGTAIILAVGFLALCLLAQVPLKPIAIIIGALVLYVVFACVTQPYHLERIITMFDPWVDPQGDGYQSVQSLYAFGSGGLFGTGLGLSRQKYLYLPYAHTDFIFAIVGEELGFIGAAALVAIFGVFIFAGIQILAACLRSVRLLHRRFHDGHGWLPGLRQHGVRLRHRTRHRQGASLHQLRRLVAHGDHDHRRPHLVGLAAHAGRCRERAAPRRPARARRRFAFRRRPRELVCGPRHLAVWRADAAAALSRHRTSAYAPRR